MNVEIYSKSNCQYCTRAKKLVLDRELDHTIIDISAGSIEDQVLAREQLIDRVVQASGTTPRTMPQIFVDGEYVGGYDQLVEYLEA